MTELAYTIGFTIDNCTHMENFQWLFTYQRHYLQFIFVLGFIENLFVISVFVFHKSRCTVAEIYLGNMAAADLAFVITLPFGAIYFSNIYLPFGDFICSAFSYMFKLNLYSSICFLMMVSIDRYLTLVKTMSIGRLRRPLWAKVTCGIIWMVTAVLSVPDALFRKMILIKKFNTTTCITDAPSPNWFITTNITLNVLGFLVPLIITAFCTFKIVCVLRNNAMKQFNRVNQERKATRLVLIVFLVFIVCWLPFNISAFIETLGAFQVFRSCMVISANYVICHFSLYIVFSNSCINPVIYCMVGNSFRRKAREVYSRLLSKVNGPRVIERV